MTMSIYHTQIAATPLFNNQHHSLRNVDQRHSLSNNLPLKIYFSQQILSGRLLLAITSGQKSNVSGRFKLEPVTTYHLGFIVNIL